MFRKYCIKCDKILCVYNRNQRCICGDIEFENGKCLQYIELLPSQETLVYNDETIISNKKKIQFYFRRNKWKKKH